MPAPEGPAGLAGVVLAGGASRRMGRDKALMPHPATPGTSMIEHTVNVLAARCGPVFVVAAPGQVLPALAARVVRDEVGGLGPLLATGRGLHAAAAAGMPRAFVAAVDMPALSAGLIDLLCGAADIADVVMPNDGRDHYLAAVYRTSLADQIDTLAQAGARSMRALIDSVDTSRVAVPAGPVLTNLNCESDLA